MQNRFGLKDFVLLVVMLAVGVSVWIGMVQDDRVFKQIAGVRNKIDNLEQRLSNLQTTIESGGIAVGTAPAAAQRDESWARPGGAPVVWWPQPAYVTDPTGNDDYSVGGTFTEIFEGQPPTVTPYRYADVYGRRVVDLVCQTLGRYHPQTLKLEGVLAEAWQYDPEGRWLRVRIRPNARFSDGQPVTAEDVRFTFHEIVFNAEIQADRFRSTLEVIDRVEAVSDRVVDFIFKEPMYRNLSAAVADLFILPKHIYSEFTPTQINESTSLLVGSGPFKLEKVDVADQWKPGEPIRLVRNEAYWGRKPALSGITFTVVQDSLARLTAFTNGQGDMMRATPKQYEAMAADSSFLEKYDPQMWFNMRGGYAFIAWQCGPRNGRLTPFHDKRVRRAMTHLIDRDLLIRDIYKNLARPATSPFSSETPQSDPSIKPWPHSVETARAILAEAGWLDRNGNGVLENEEGNEFRFAITFGQGSEGTLQMVTYVKDQCAKVGIVCDLNPIDWSILSDILDKRDFDAVTFAWSPNDPESDPNQIWHSSQIDGTGDNFIQWNCPEADRLIDQGRATIDFDKRMKIWHQLHAVFHDEQPYTFMLEMPWLRFLDKRVGNFQKYRSGFEYQELYIRGGGGAAAVLP